MVKCITLGAKAPSKATNVYDYFREQLGRIPFDSSLRELPLDSGCGQDCRTAIDRAAKLKQTADMAADDLGRMVVGVADDVCRIFWRG
jgi:hypothetical protein